MPDLKLHATSVSPFVRKVLIFAYERGIESLIERIPAAYPTLPTERNPAIVADNPLGKVPTLILPDGEPLFDSTVICEYLDTLGDAVPLIPVAGFPRWRTLRLNALADGIMEAGIAIRLERLRPSHLHWQSWIDGHLFKIDSALELLEENVETLSAHFHIGQIAVAAALPWLEFREVYPDLKSRHPRIAGWLEKIEQRTSMLRTRPA